MKILCLNFLTMRLVFRHWTVDQLHVLSLTFTEVVTTYLTFRFEFGYLARNFKRFPTTRQQSFDLGIALYARLFIPFHFREASFAFCGFPFPLEGCHYLTVKATDVMGNRPQTLLGLLRFTSKRCDRVWVPPLLREGFWRLYLLRLR